MKICKCFLDFFSRITA